MRDSDVLSICREIDRLLADVSPLIDQIEKGGHPDAEAIVDCLNGMGILESAVQAANELDVVEEAVRPAGCTGDGTPESCPVCLGTGFIDVGA
jgi:hypothetical protein